MAKKEKPTNQYPPFDGHTIDLGNPNYVVTKVTPFHRLETYFNGRLKRRTLLELFDLFEPCTLTVLRNHTGLSQRDFGEIVGYKQRQISSFENGENVPYDARVNIIKEFYRELLTIYKNDWGVDYNEESVFIKECCSVDPELEEILERITPSVVKDTRVRSGKTVEEFSDSLSMSQYTLTLIERQNKDAEVSDYVKAALIDSYQTEVLLSLGRKPRKETNT